MPEPRKELIAAAVAVQLATITVANGYETDVAEVVRPTKEGGYQPADRMIVLMQGDETPVPDAAYFTGEWIAEWYAVCLLRQSETATQAIDILKNRFEADVRKALMVNPQWSLVEPRLAVDTELRGSLSFDVVGHQGFEGVTVVFAIQYRTAIDDPYAAG